MQQTNQGTLRQEQNSSHMPAIVRVALIPAYEPGEHMVRVVRALHEAGMEVVVVNDGSSAACDAAFQQVAVYATILSHANNRGKGEALKTGLRYIQTTFGSGCLVVTVDADGQHAANDVLHVCSAARQCPNALTLGMRSFDGEVPLRSKLGNSLTRGVFRVASGVAVHDTQTGLRAFAGALIPRLLAIDGSRYEYETNMLLELARDGVPLQEVPIRTIYLNENAASHFDPLRDSVRIYGRILRFSASSLVSFGIDYLLFCALLPMLGVTTICNVCARVVSGTINFALNRRVVFGGGGSAVRSFVRYVALAVSLLVCNTVLLGGLVGWGISAHMAKIAVELALFLVSFCVQQRFVFAEKGVDHGKKLEKNERSQAVVAGVSDGARGSAGMGRQVLAERPALASAQKALVGTRV